MSPFIDHALFMTACGQTVAQHNEDQAALYKVLIEEEFEEFMGATTELDQADACIDMIVVIIGYMLSRGWNAPALWKEVHRSNMAKIDPATGKVIRREDGKILKPDGWTPPNLEPILCPRS